MNKPMKRVQQPTGRRTTLPTGQRARVDCGLLTAWYTTTPHEYVVQPTRDDPPDLDKRPNVRVQQLAPGLFKAQHRHEGTWCGPIALKMPSLREALKFAHLAWLDTMSD